MKKDNTDKKSSWGAAGVSVLKEFFLNFSGPGHLYYEENLSDEGIRKKEKLISVHMRFLYRQQ